MTIIRAGLVITCLYISGLVLYSSLFIFSANQAAWAQVLKIFVASVYSFFLILPAMIAQKRNIVLRIIGYAILIICFGYIFFLVGYFRYFGFVPEITALGTGNVADVAGVLDHYWAQIFGIREIVLIAVAALILFLLSKHTLPAKSLLVLFLPCLLFSVNWIQYGAPLQSKSFGNETVIRRFGLPVFFYLSLKEDLQRTSEYLTEETAFPGNLRDDVLLIASADASTTKIDLAPVDKVVLVQIESLDNEAIDSTLNGNAVMPFVSALRNDSCLEFTNFHTVKSVGGSSDSEFSVATGLLPSSKRQSLRNANFGDIQTLYELLAAAGIDSYFAHNNNIGFYGRNHAYAQMPHLDTTFLSPEQDITEQAFAVQGLESALSASDRLFYYFFNFQSHGPYRGYSQSAGERFTVSLNASIKDHYLATMYDVDQMIADLFTLQAEDFQQGNSLFIVTSDHPSYLHSDSTLLSRSRIPTLICHSAFSGTQVANLGSTIDFFPTLLDAFDVPGADRSYAASLFSVGPRIVLFPSGKVLQQQEDGELSLKACTTACQPYFDYTDQYIRVSR